MTHHNLAIPKHLSPSLYWQRTDLFLPCVLTSLQIHAPTRGATVKSIIKSQLDTASHFDGSVNDAYASLVANFYAVHAQKLGATPEALYQRYPLKVDSLLTDGQAFGQRNLVPNTTELGAFKTGQPVTFDFQHNTESATKIFGKPKKDAPYDRGIEPSGRYVTQVKDASKVDTSGHYISGTLSFKNPLVLNSETWKKDLFDHYKKRGKALSKALIADGYDGVVTISHDERPGRSDTSEILDLTTFDESKALYQSANDEPLLAPNGKPSNLNAVQHAQVRTEAFKKWFGDWETVANLNWLDHGDPVVSMVGDEIPTLKGIAKLADWIAQNWIDRKETVIDRSDLGEITIDRKAVKDSASHGLSKSKVQAYYLVPEVIRDGKVLGTLPHQVGKPDAVIIAAPVKIGENNYKMYVEVRHDANMKRMYVHEVVLNDPATAFKTAAEVPEGSKLHSANRGAIFSFIQNLRDVKSSKVVDENGEPLVVYHGTTENFTEFAGRQSWKAQFKEDIGTSYFTSDKEMAEGYANGKNPIAVFLSLKNPYQYDADGMSYFGANYNSLTKARVDAHDGFNPRAHAGRDTILTA